MENKKVLIVDDDAIGRTVLRKVLENQGCVCIEAVTGAEARRLLSEKDFDLVLLDIELPDASGLELLSEIRKSKDALSLPVIMVTSSEDPQSKITAVKNGANDYISKPVNFEVTLTRVLTHLKLSDLSRFAQAAKEIQAVNSMILTYNHEINNPLAIAMGFLQQVSRSVTAEKEVVALERTLNALERIAEILRVMNQLVERGQELQFEPYSSKASMLKIK